MSESARMPDHLIVEQVMHLWDQKLDTNEIAKRLGEREHVIERLLHIGKEARQP